ncbi:hypothetical protein AMTRI_Chr08g202020 [Amborella trichopoda]|uniref:Uncharacterized protein n=1 Tax=Amborella trichopoda TaxID=13333 RepID=W1PPX4_AMBTC|nr:hypothetical protein AMTR_s00029p00235680 [Amborella trichopoda]
MSEITDEDGNMDSEAQKNMIRRIIQYQKLLYLSSSAASSSSSSSSLSASASSSLSSSFSSLSQRRLTLLELMKARNGSLKRLFSMEHTSLSKHFNDYSGSPVIKPLYLWESDTDESIPEPALPWPAEEKFRVESVERGEAIDRAQYILKEEGRERNDDTSKVPDFSRPRFGNRRTLTRKKSYRALPRFSRWRWRGFRLRLRRLRIFVCGRII